MAPLIILALYSLMFLLIKLVVPLEMSDEVRLVFNIVGGIGVLVLPIVIYSFIDFKLTQRAVNVVGKNWCQVHDKQFNKVDMHKNHFTLVYQEGNKKARKKFRVRFILTTWFVKSVEWLDK
ncbi:hypothetical protein [Kangiella shandongensis]|uniref:hypothetical protein n=1 Tax=Kangiella shandongensis TaxID=2763258 RepID=UPI001CBB8524|nr:hypothetical protein [Kangiella shandongensis]